METDGEKKLLDEMLFSNSMVNNQVRHKVYYRGFVRDREWNRKQARFFRYSSRLDPKSLNKINSFPTKQKSASPI